MKYLKIYIVIIFAFCISSCLLLLYQTPKLMRENIVKRNDRIIKVGIIEDYSVSDHKYSSLDIVFENNGHLYLTLIDNYFYQTKIKGRQPYFITRIGDYSFGTYVQWRRYDGREMRYFKEGYGMNPVLLEQELNIKLRTVQDAINNYNILYNYISSLPYLDIIRNEHEELKNNLDKYKSITLDKDSRLHKYSENTVDRIGVDLDDTIYPFRIDWNDKYFDLIDSLERRPDYYYRQ